jgi:hypothetical protein
MILHIYHNQQGLGLFTYSDLNSIWTDVVQQLEGVSVDIPLFLHFKYITSLFPLCIFFVSHLQYSLHF